MSDREAFLRAIRAEPDDDTVRLAFADWLDEHGEPERAEFIRVQCELEPVRDRLEEFHVRQLIQREEQLQVENNNRIFWAAFECDDHLSHPEFIDFRRGLPEVMCVSLGTLLQRGDLLLNAYPTIRELAVFDIAGRGDQLAACPLLGRIDVLEIADRLTADDDRMLAASPHLDSIRRFVLWGGWSSYVGEALAPHLPAEWSGRIDVLWLEDGLAVGIGAEECDEPIDPAISYAQPINDAAGRKIAFDVRPARRLFSLRGWNLTATTHEQELELGIDSGHGLFYGRLPDGTQAILATQDGPWYLARFREDGRLIGIDEQPCPLSDWSAGTYEDVLARVADYQLRPAVLRVREFGGSNHFGIHLWTRGMVSQYFDRVDRHPRLPEADWRSRGGEICEWLRHRHFVIDWGNDHWSDWRGIIHSS